MNLKNPRTVALFRNLLGLGLLTGLMAAPQIAHANYWFLDSGAQADAGNQVSWPVVQRLDDTQSPWPTARPNTHACFLTGMWGDFNGAGEQVRTVVYGDRWVVEAKSGSGNGVGAWANCVSIPDSSYRAGPFTWNQGNAATKISLPQPNSGYDWSCFLTSVAGKFQGKGESVEVYGSGRNWYISGSSAQKGVSGQAECVQTLHRTGDYQVAQGSSNSAWAQLIEAGGTNSAWYGSATPIGRPYFPTNPNRCFLKRVTGKFEGSGELVRVVFDGVGHNVGKVNLWWTLLNSQQKDVAATVACAW